jgi:hypothetical protein
MQLDYGDCAFMFGSLPACGSGGCSQSFATSPQVRSDAKRGVAVSQTIAKRMDPVHLMRSRCMYASKGL